TIPPTSALNASTVEYGEVFAADQRQLRDWFAGRAAVIGDFTAHTDDFHEHPDGRRLAGTYAIAVGIDSMLSFDSIRTPSDFAIVVLTMMGALVGVAVGAFFGRSRSRAVFLAALLTVTLLGLCVLATAASLTAFRMQRYLCDPLVPLSAAG